VCGIAAAAVRAHLRENIDQGVMGHSRGAEN
jgi:hypothetical protein